MSIDIENKINVLLINLCNGVDEGTQHFDRTNKTYVVELFQSKFYVIGCLRWNE